MSDTSFGNPADILYAEGKRFDWQQDDSPASAALARSFFQQAASMGHTGALRALAHMIYDGKGGSQDKELAILMLWSAFRRGDHDSLEELADVLGDFSEAGSNSTMAAAAGIACRQIEEISERLDRVKTFMSGLMGERRASHTP